MPYASDSTDIRGYTYNADVHCVRCAQRAYGPAASGDVCTLCGYHEDMYPTCEHGYVTREDYDRYGVLVDAVVNADGDTIGVVFGTTDSPDYDEHCGDCAAFIRGGRLCPGCDNPHYDCTCCGECGSAYHATENCPDNEDFDSGPEDDYFEESGCDCVDCVAASEYVAGVQ